MKVLEPQFVKLIRRFVGPYKKNVLLNIICNILSTVFSIFSFALIVPILEILFKTKSASYVYMDFKWDVDVIKNNAYCWVSNYIENNGALNTLMLLAIFLIVTTFLKTGVAYLASYFIIPLRTGLVRDMRNQLYTKVVDLNLAFFGKQKNHFIKQLFDYSKLHLQ